MSADDRIAELVQALAASEAELTASEAQAERERYERKALQREMETHREHAMKMERERDETKQLAEGALDAQGESDKRMFQAQRERDTALAESAELRGRLADLSRAIYGFASTSTLGHLDTATLHVPVLVGDIRRAYAALSSPAPVTEELTAETLGGAKLSGTFACPICGLDKPHGHDSEDLYWTPAKQLAIEAANAIALDAMQFPPPRAGAEATSAPVTAPTNDDGEGTP